MLMTKQQRASFESACKPLIKWLNVNTNPYSTVVVTTTGAELLSPENRFVCKDFVPGVQRLK